MEEEREGFYVAAARHSGRIDLRVSAMFVHTLPLLLGNMTDADGRGRVCLAFEESKSEGAFEDE